MVENNKQNYLSFQESLSEVKEWLEMVGLDGRINILEANGYDCLFSISQCLDQEAEELINLFEEDIAKDYIRYNIQCLKETGIDNFRLYKYKKIKEFAEFIDINKIKNLYKPTTSPSEDFNKKRERSYTYQIDRVNEVEERPMNPMNSLFTRQRSKWSTTANSESSSDNIVSIVNNDSTCYFPEWEEKDDNTIDKNMKERLFHGSQFTITDNENSVLSFYVWIDPSLDYLIYHSEKNKTDIKGFIKITDIKKVIEGIQHPQFHIIADHQYLFECNSIQLMKQWVHDLLCLVEYKESISSNNIPDPQRYQIRCPFNKYKKGKHQVYRHIKTDSALERLEWCEPKPPYKVLNSIPFNSIMGVMQNYKQQPYAYLIIAKKRNLELIAESNENDIIQAKEFIKALIYFTSEITSLI